MKINKTLVSIVRKTENFLMSTVAVFIGMVIIGSIGLFAYFLYKFLVCPPQAGIKEYIEAMKDIFVALISVGGFCITVFLLIRDNRKKQIDHYLGQICAYSVEEHLMLDEINKLRQQQGLEKLRLPDFRELARNDAKNYLKQYPSMTSQKAAYLATMNAH